MKSMNYDKKDDSKGTIAKIAEKAAGVLMKRGVEEQMCIMLFTYEPEIPSDVLMSQKVK